MDKQKADKIITEYMQKIYGFAMKKAFSYDEAEELCADIIKEVYVSLRSAEEVVNPDAYILRISRNVYAKHVSANKRQEGISLDGLEIAYFDKYSVDESDDEISRLRREVAFLTKTRRRVVYSFYYEGKRISEIAKELNLAEGTVKWHLNKGRNELKEGFSMERKIGKLGMKPLEATNIGHGGEPGSKGGPEYYLFDKLNLNIVYSVYYEPKSKEEIAQELGVTLVFIEDKIDNLEENGFWVPTANGKYTTYVMFGAETYSQELIEKVYMKRQEIAQMLVEEYVPQVREAIKDIEDVYIPSGNRELFEAAVITYAITNNCSINIDKDISKYRVKTTDGGDYLVFVNDVPAERSDPDYVSRCEVKIYSSCGSMTRGSTKYPGVDSWSLDTGYCSRKGYWENNLVCDFEYVYEFVKGEIKDTPANEEKFKRLKSREYISDDGKVNIMMMKCRASEFRDMIPKLGEELKAKFADTALELAMVDAKRFPPQMQDLVIWLTAGNFVENQVALMVKGILYSTGVFKKMTEEEMITSDLIMFSDVLPEEE